MKLSSITLVAPGFPSYFSIHQAPLMLPLCRTFARSAQLPVPHNAFIIAATSTILKTPICKGFAGVLKLYLTITSPSVARRADSVTHREGPGRGTDSMFTSWSPERSGTITNPPLPVALLSFVLHEIGSPFLNYFRPERK